MEQYNVTGMSCAACSARVEKAVSKLEGVQSCSVSLLTNSMGVEGTASPAEIIKAVEEAGYGASVKGAAGSGTSGSVNSVSEQEDMLRDRETPLLKKRLAASLIFLIILMYFSMGHMMWGWPVPDFFDENHVAMGLLQLLLTAVVMVINQKFFVSGFRGLIHRSPNMDTLVALGSSAAFGYSVVVLFAMTGAQARGDTQAVMEYMHEFYFESAAMILALITVGKMLEARSKGRTTDALRSLMRLAPETAVIIENGEEKEVPVDHIKKGDIFAVRPGETIPVDGVIIEGSSAVNEAALTGESIPVDKEAGDHVSAASINQSGYIRCEATRVGEDTTLSRIIKMVSDAAATKAPIAKVADKVSGVFVPAVIAIAAVTTAVWLMMGQTAGFALARGISVLVISCPCALGLATPVAIMVGNGMGAKNGILFKTAVSLEETGRTQIVALDKTGTITSGEPAVTDIIEAEGYSAEELIKTAAALESRSEHPLAKAIMREARTEDIRPAEVSDFKAVPGNGLTAVLDGRKICGGNLRFITAFCEVPETMVSRASALAEEGKTPIFFADGDKPAGIIAVADVIKPDSREAVEAMKNMGIKVVMLTGDNEKTANAIGREAGVDEVIAGVLPEGKESVIRKLREKGRVIMVGDGINDAPALTRADVGIAIGAGTDVAIDAADVVLMKNTLSDVPAAIRLSRATLRNIHENLFWAFIYNIIGIPLAAGVFISLLGWQLNPMFGAAAMSLSSFCVVSNALRLNWFKMYDSGSDHKIKDKLQGRVTQAGPEKEKEIMEKTVKIEGMMCAHCEAAVKKALEELPQVEKADVSHEKGTATVTLSCRVDDDVLKKAVEDKDYKVTGIE